jgi:hypothetical protein
MLYRSIGLGLTPVFNARLVIASNVDNYNLSSALQALGWVTAKRARVEITINSGVTVGSTSTGSPAFLVNLKDVDYVTIINNGNIFGAAGAGGGSFDNSNGEAGGAGGTALQALSNVRVVNNGIIGGGGGGGGGAGASRALVSYTPSCPGGTTYRSSLGGSFGTCGVCVASSVYFQSYATCTPNYSYPAGAAGAAGVAGSGSDGLAGNSPWYSGGAGGAAGNYYQGSNKITVVTAGTVRGNIVA